MTILVFGNSGSGESTLARRLAVLHEFKVLDLDNVVWSRTDDLSLTTPHRLFESFTRAKREIGAAEMSDGSPFSL